ncbi:hypothetical protein MJG53_019859 [Ovis ammon polii x Ovis aries]|uniref:Uncharacterized protein n=1 Tax=Ovis ammon polii x Ovis aries TaxID=2918886 RepID=A0ACB9U0Z4_9CETA|nr:hypothetical protein MJG53_019859 [Ovis ammon polii x Ovis aries]
MSSGAAGTRRRKQRSEARVLRSESRGGPGSTRSQVALNEMLANLIKFLLLMHPAKELTSQVEMLKKVLRHNQEHFLVVFSQASRCLQLVCGVEVKEVEAREHIYIMVPTVGLTYDTMLNSGQGLPKAGLPVLVLSLITWNGDRAPEEKGPNPETANKEENNTVLRLSFPRKLWMIVEDAAFTSVHWKNKGDTVVIKADLFQTEVLQGRGVDRIFETDSIQGFICELNLYEFSKIHPSGITLVVEMSELSKPKEDFQDPGEAQGPVNAQLLGAEAGVAASASASSPTVSSLGTGESLPQEALNEMIASLMKFLLLKYRAKEPTSQAEMLNKVLRDNQEYFPVVFSQASQCLQLVFGVEVKEVDPREHIYIMVSILGLSCNAMLSSGQSIPKAGLLVLVLNLIMRNGDRAPEEKVWGALSRLGVYAGSVHCIFGEPRTLLTHVWVQEGYLEYRQVPYSRPARYEFLWGPRAYAETSKWEIMAFLLRVKQRALRAFPLQSAGAAREDDEAD